MNANEIVAALQSGYVAVTVRFPHEFARGETPSWTEKTYTYKALQSLNIKPEDYVVVIDPHDIPKVVKVVTVSEDVNLDFSNVFQYKWVAQKVDLTTHDSITKQEADLTLKVQMLMRRQAQERFLKEFSTALDGNPQKDEILSSLRREADMSGALQLEKKD